MSSVRGTGLYTSFPSQRPAVYNVHARQQMCDRSRSCAALHIDDGLRVGELHTIRAFHFYLNFLFRPVCLCAFSYSCGSVVILAIIRNYAETILLLFVSPSSKEWRTTFSARLSSVSHTHQKRINDWLPSGRIFLESIRPPRIIWFWKIVIIIIWAYGKPEKEIAIYLRV